MSEKHILLSVLFFQESDSPNVWVAQALQYDIAAYGVDIPAAKRAFAHTLRGHLILAERHHREPFLNLRKAPDMFWTIWQRLIDEQQTPVSAESLRTFPAFMIPAVSHEPLPPTH